MALILSSVSILSPTPSRFKASFSSFILNGVARVALMDRSAEGICPGSSGSTAGWLSSFIDACSPLLSGATTCGIFCGSPSFALNSSFCCSWISGCWRQNAVTLSAIAGLNSSTALAKFISNRGGDSGLTSSRSSPASVLASSTSMRSFKCWISMTLYVGLMVPWGIFSLNFQK